MNQIRQSTAMNDSEKRRALGLGLMGFGSQLSQPGHGKGFAGVIGAMNAGFNPAVNAYLAEQNRIEQQNANALKMVMDAESKQADREFRERQLQETKRYHNLLAQTRNKEDRIEREVGRVQALHPDAIPMLGMSQGQITDVHKKREEILKDNRKITDVIKNVENLIELHEKNPQLYSEFSSTLDPDSFIGRHAMSSETRAARKKADLVSRNLALDQISRGVGSARMGQFLEKMVNESKINYLTPLEDKKRVLSELKQEQERLNHAAERVKAAKKGRYDLPDYFDDEDGEPSSINDINSELSENSSNEPSQVIILQSPDGKTIKVSGNITPEKILQLEQKGFKRVE